MSKLDTLKPEFKTIILDVITQVSVATGLDWIPISCRRTIQEQNDLYAQGRTEAGSIVTKAKGGQSPHNFGLACDCAPIKSGSVWWNAPQGYWDTYGAIAKSHGLTWGGDFHSIQDNPHCEMPTWKEQQALWREGKIEVA